MCYDTVNDGNAMTENIKTTIVQGLDIAKSLGLPPDGEEPWERATDMAHNAVDWRAAYNQVQQDQPM